MDASFILENGPYAAVVTVCLAGYGPVWWLLRQRDKAIEEKDKAAAKVQLVLDLTK